jgi:hypothetical protein
LSQAGEEPRLDVEVLAWTFSIINLDTQFTVLPAIAGGLTPDIQSQVLMNN